jgi:hypothetical protein
VFLPILEKLRFALDSSILHADEEAKFFEVSRLFPMRKCRTLVLGTAVVLILKKLVL